jgi:hypothetical protein
MAALAGGVRAPIVVVYPGTILMDGLMTRRRQALGVGARTVLVTAVYVAADHWGSLPMAMKQGADQVRVYLV